MLKLHINSIEMVQQIQMPDSIPNILRDSIRIHMKFPLNAIEIYTYPLYIYVIEKYGVPWMPLF